MNISIDYVTSIFDVTDQLSSYIYFKSKTGGLSFAFSFLTPTQILYSGTWDGSRRRLGNYEPNLDDILDLAAGREETQFDLPETINLSGNSVPRADVSDFVNNGPQNAMLSGKPGALETADQGVLATVGSALSSSVSFVTSNVAAGIRFVPNLTVELLDKSISMGVREGSKLMKSLSDFLGAGVKSIASGTSQVIESAGSGGSILAQGIGAGGSNLAQGAGLGISTAAIGVGAGGSNLAAGIGAGGSDLAQGVGMGSGAFLAGGGQALGNVVESSATGIGSILSGNSGITLAVVAGLYFFSQKK